MTQFDRIVFCARCLSVQRLGDIGDNKLSLEVFNTLRKEPAASDICPWLVDIQRNFNKVIDLGENAFLFCERCYLLSLRDIELFEVRHIPFIHSYVP